MSSVSRSRFLDDLDPKLLEVTRVEDTSRRLQSPWLPARGFERQAVKNQIALDEPGLVLDLEDSQLDEFLDGDIDAEAFLHS